MTDETKLVERRLPRIAGRTLSFPFDLSWGELAVLLCSGLALSMFMLLRTDPATIIATAVAVLVLCAVFIVPLNRTGERAIHLIPRYAAFAGRWAVGAVDVHARQIEGRHHTHRPVPHDVPLSHHLGKRLHLSSFEWRGRQIGLIVQGGSHVKPWAQSYAVAVQVSGKGQMLLESNEHQEQLLARWNAALNALCKRDLGLSAMQELMLSRPLVQGEGAHWDFDAVLEEQDPDLAEMYRQVQLIHDQTAHDRRMFVVLRSGGTFSSWARGKHWGSNRAGAEEHFRGVLGKLATVLSQAQLNLVRTLDVHQMHALFRLCVDPTFAPALGYREGERDVHALPVEAAPIEHWEEHHSYLVVNGVYTATYRVVGWPDAVRGPSFLAAALLHHPGGLRVSVVMEPEDPTTSKYLARAGMTNSANKAGRRNDLSRVETESDRLAESTPAQRDVEMAHHHHPLVYSVYLTSIADDRDSLRRATDDLATQCDGVGVDLGCCHGWQKEAYRNTLPLGRGVG